MEEVKRAEIMAAERLRHRVVLSHYIRTSAGPPLHWLPAVATPATDALLAREKERLEIWKVPLFSLQRGLPRSPSSGVYQLEGLSLRNEECSSCSGLAIIIRVC